MSEFRLDDQVAIVTGANRPNGIGRAIAYELADAGAFVVATARTHEGVEEIDDAFEEKHIEGSGVFLDLEDFDSFADRLKTVREDAGRLATILVNNAALTMDAPSLATKPSRLTQIMNVNFVGPSELTREFLRAHRKEQSTFGRVINIGSVVGEVGHSLQLGYAASKAALANATKTWSQEWPQVADWADPEELDFTFNTVVPGYIAGTELTNRIPEAMRPELLGRIPSKLAGTPEQVASVVRFIASREAKYMNGQSVRVDGGLV